MNLKIDKSFLKGLIIASILAPIIVHFVINYAIDPYLNPKEKDIPNLEIIARDPVFFYPENDVIFNITFENTGKKTASELFIRAYTEDYDTKSSYSHISGYDKILQEGEITSVLFEFTAPDNVTKHPEWTMRVVATTTDNYSWDFDITYVYEPDKELYHITPRTS